VAITLVGSATTANNPSGTQSTSLTCNKPTGTADGDLMLALLARESGTALTVPPGWITLEEAQTSVLRYTLIKRLAGASEPADYTFTASSTGSIAVAISAWHSTTGKFVDVDNWISKAQNSIASQTGDSVTTSNSGYQLYFQTGRMTTVTETTYSSGAATAELFDHGLRDNLSAVTHAGYWINSELAAGSIGGQSVTFNQTVDGGAIHYNVVIFETTSYSGTSSQDFTATGSWVAPSGVTTADVLCIGGGGAGGKATGNPAVGGGGAGGSSAHTPAYAVTGGNTYTVTVAAQGSQNAGTTAIAGGDSWFDSTSGVVAKGGPGGAAGATNSSSGAGGTGTTTGCIGTTVRAGGSGGTGTFSVVSGAGGGAAGATAVGGNATAGTPGTGNSPGGDGETGISSSAAGNTCTLIGGGGGGGYASTNTDRNGGGGGPGFVRVTIDLSRTSGGGGGPTVQDSVGLLHG
jgi:hypothetical protein